MLFFIGQLLARTNEGAAGVEPTHANAPIYPVFPGIRLPCTHYAKERDYSPLFVMYFTGTYMVRTAQVQASSLMRAIAPHTSGCRRGAAPHLPASPTNRRRSTLGASHVIALAPWPLVLRLSPRPAWAKIRNSLPRYPHAGLGTYPRVPYVSTPRGTQGFGDRRAVLVILSCAGTRRISQHRIACSAPPPSCRLRDSSY